MIRDQLFRIGQGNKWVGGTVAGAAAVVVGGTAGVAQAELRHSVVDAVIDSSQPDYSVDFRGDGSPEFKIHYDSTLGLVAQKIPVAGPYYLAGSTPNQIKALALGDMIDGADPAFTAFVSASPLLRDGSGNGEFTVSAGQKYVGVKLNAGEVGWIGFRVTNDSSPAALSGTVHDFALETDTALGIGAGVVPEPTSVALLALGASALAAYRRRGAVAAVR